MFALSRSLSSTSLLSGDLQLDAHGNFSAPAVPRFASVIYGGSWMRLRSWLEFPFNVRTLDQLPF